MGIATAIRGAASGIISPIAGVFNKRTERKINKETIRGKLAMQQQGDATSITLTDAEWETVGQHMQADSWKDEYVTVSFVSIVNMIIVGGIAAAFGYPQVLEGMVLALTKLAELGLDLGEIIWIVVLAAVGLKAWRAL